LDALEAEDAAAGVDQDTDVGCYPVGVSLRRPAVDEQPEGNQDTAEEHEWEAEFGPSGVVVPSAEAAVNAIGDEGGEMSPEDGTETEGDVGQAGDAAGFVVALDPEVGEVAEDEV